MTSWLSGPPSFGANSKIRLKVTEGRGLEGPIRGTDLTHSDRIGSPAGSSLGISGASLGHPWGGHSLSPSILRGYYVISIYLSGSGQMQRKDIEPAVSRFSALAQRSLHIEGEVKRSPLQPQADSMEDPIVPSVSRRIALGRKSSAGGIPGPGWWMRVMRVIG